MSTPVVTRTTLWALRRRLFWAGLAAAGVAYELHALQDEAPGDTLSETTRILFRTDTTWGRRIFTGAWVLLSALFVPHICKTAKAVASN